MAGCPVLLRHKKGNFIQLAKGGEGEIRLHAPQGEQARVPPFLPARHQ